MKKLLLLFAVTISSLFSRIEPKSIVIPSRPDLTKNYNLALEAIFGMGIRLQALNDKNVEENFLISPVSATVVIGQLMLGAEGDLQDKLYNLLSLPNGHIYKNDRMHNRNTNTSQILPYTTLHLQLSSLLKALEGNSSLAKNFILKQKSAVFVNERIGLKEEFTRNLQNFYNSELFLNMNFHSDPINSQRIINSWASRQTNGLIKSLFPIPPRPDTSSIFANAIYFLAEWETPFSHIFNQNGQFSVTNTKSVNVTYMHGNLENIPFAKTNDFKLMGLPYKNNELVMYFLLPNPGTKYEYNLKLFAKDIKSKELLDLVNNIKRNDVFVKVPKLSLTNRVNILDPLRKYTEYRKQQNNNEIKVDNRMIDPVENLDYIVDKYTDSVNNSLGDGSNIYLSNAAFSQPMKVSNIVQEVIFSLNEKGTEAAAVSAGTIDYMLVTNSFIIEKPFLFFIRHEATSTVLFWGSINNPAG